MWMWVWFNPWLSQVFSASFFHYLQWDNLGIQWKVINKKKHFFNGKMFKIVFSLKSFGLIFGQNIWVFLASLLFPNKICILPPLGTFWPINHATFFLPAPLPNVAGNFNDKCYPWAATVLIEVGVFCERVKVVLKCAFLFRLRKAKFYCFLVFDGDEIARNAGRRPAFRGWKIKKSSYKTGKLIDLGGFLGREEDS